MKRQMNDLKNKIASDKTELHQDLRDAIQELVDENDRTMSLTVDVLGSTFNLEKQTAKHAPSKKESVDYTAIAKQLIELLKGNDGLEDQVNKIIKANTKILDVAGKARALRVKLKQEAADSSSSVVNKILNWIKTKFNKFIGTLKKSNTSLESKLKSINSDISNISESTNLRKRIVREESNDNPMVAKILSYLKKFKIHPDYIKTAKLSDGEYSIIVNPMSLNGKIEFMIESNNNVSAYISYKDKSQSTSSTFSVLRKLIPSSITDIYTTTD